MMVYMSTHYPPSYGPQEDSPPILLLLPVPLPLQLQLLSNVYTFVIDFTIKLIIYNVFFNLI